MRALSKDSIHGEVPEKYLLVRNSDLVRIRYLLVYCKPHAHQNRSVIPQLKVHIHTVYDNFLLKITPGILLFIYLKYYNLFFAE
jgi:hypothetical protein